MLFNNQILKFQFGVSNVSEISGVLGDESSLSRISSEEESESGSVKKSHTENLLWKDSSLFLKVNVNIA